MNLSEPLDDYAGPVRLARNIPWGKPDPLTARAIVWSAQRVNPPIVIPWHPKETRTRRCLEINGAPIA